jgi:pimeloyl-ACP methyl ester carboxylesterase
MGSRALTLWPRMSQRKGPALKNPSDELVKAAWLVLSAAGNSDGWHLDAKAIECPVRVVWGTDDRILKYPVAATRFREEWLPAAEWIELDAVGHLPRVDVPAEAADLVLGFAQAQRYAASAPAPSGA